MSKRRNRWLPRAMNSTINNPEEPSSPRSLYATVLLSQALLHTPNAQPGTATQPDPSLTCSTAMANPILAGNGNSPDLGPSSALIFLGTGCSSAVPNARCLIQPTDPPCNICFQALSVPPMQNPNYR